MERWALERLPLNGWWICGSQKQGSVVVAVVGWWVWKLVVLPVDALGFQVLDGWVSHPRANGAVSQLPNWSLGWLVLAQPQEWVGTRVDRLLQSSSTSAGFNGLERR